jgi:hypothetical protein
MRSLDFPLVGFRLTSVLADGDVGDPAGHRLPPWASLPLSKASSWHTVPIASTIDQHRRSLRQVRGAYLPE